MECSIEDRETSSTIHAMDVHGPATHTAGPSCTCSRADRPRPGPTRFAPMSGAVFVTFVLRMLRCYVTSVGAASYRCRTACHPMAVCTVRPPLGRSCNASAKVRCESAAAFRRRERLAVRGQYAGSADAQCLYSNHIAVTPRPSKLSAYRSSSGRRPTGVDAAHK